MSVSSKALCKYAFILILFSLLVTPIHLPQLSSENAGRYVKSKVIIVIDEGHGGIFGYKEMIEFLSRFNESLYMEEGIRVKVYSIRGELNASSMIGADLLIIPPTNGSISYTSNEGRVLLDYIKTGGSVLILGAPFNIGNPDISYLNDLLLFMKQDISFYYETGSGDLIRDDINGDGSIIYFNEQQADRELSDLFSNVNDYIKVSSCSIDYRQKNNTYVIKTGPTAYRINNQMNIYYNNSGYNILVARKISYGLLTVIGFGEILTNITSPYNGPWFNISDNFQFSYNLIKWLLQLGRWVVEERELMHPLHIYLLVSSLPVLAMYPIARRIDEKRRRRIEERKKEVKISEIIKKAREKGKK